ncbi:hypothetical protein IE53DRAFT_407058 [Violaceomyces palustris]|uniref:Uncharacterized protein n=1 Tax=Violaceomyces palustris TaxID=1673888 RepID=A0ACD0NRV7_9BASI|nr:hypothetical protein IE53DRAFT_407058 [Violaceomyces palustris]
MVMLPTGVHHRRKDFYSESSPIPSIQRFFKQGLAEVVARREESESEDSDPDDGTRSFIHQSHRRKRSDATSGDADEDDVNSGLRGSKRQSWKLGRVFSLRKREAVEEDDQWEGEREDGGKPGEQTPVDQEGHQRDEQPFKRTRKPRLVDDPVTGSKIYIHDVGRKEYARAISQAAGPTGASTMVDSDFAAAGKDAIQQGNPKEDVSHTSKHTRQDPHPIKRTLSRSSKARFKRFRNSQNHQATLSSVGAAGAENVLNLTFPPDEPLPNNLNEVHPYLLPLFACWAVLTMIGYLPRWLSVMLNAWLGWWVFKTIKDGAEDRRWWRERRRGESARKGFHPDMNFSDGLDGSLPNVEGIKEGAEWLNGLMEGLWAVMNPDLFSSLGSTLEDVMQASIPGFIHAVKVEDLSQGSTPLRITGLRILPDKEVAELRAQAHKAMRDRSLKEKKVRLPNEMQEDREYEGGSVEKGERPNPSGDQSKESADANGIKDAGRTIYHDPSVEQHEPNIHHLDEDSGGSYINLELSFVYRARPTAHTVASKSRNAHLLIKFWIGARKLYTIPLPVWVEIKGLVGSLRARIQLTPDPPFVKNVTFTFCGLPRVGVEVIPLHINTSNIPFISGFIQSSIDAAIGEYVAPSSMTMDVGEMLMGDNIKREVNALGVVVVYIHKATDLEKQDIRGSSDPYCTLSWAKYGKVLYSTRVALNDLSPRWEERHVIIVTPETIRSKERVSIALWDSDRFSSDDMLGRADVDLIDLVNHPGKMFSRQDTLVGLSQEMKKEGIIHWSLGFFEKAPNKRRMEDGKKNSVDGGERDWGKGDEGKVSSATHRTSEVSERIGEARKKKGERGEMETKAKEKAHCQKVEKKEGDGSERVTKKSSEEAIQTRNQETAVQFEPPDPNLPSGIISMQIHQISNLEVVDTRNHFRKRGAQEAGQSFEQIENDEDSSQSPSPYVTIILNDETVFRTRTKALSSNPFFNAGTERFVRDWRRALVMFVVHDFRLRESDPILGVVPIKLSDLFKETSQVTQFFPISGGLGQGRIRLSILFRPIMEMSREKAKLGWNIGTVRMLTNPVAGDFIQESGSSASDLHLASIRARTLAGSLKIPGHRARYSEGTAKSEVEWKMRPEEFPLKVPARRRYAAPFIIEYRSVNSLGKKKVVAMSIIWMQDLADDEIMDERLPIYKPKDGFDLHRLKQNYHHYKNESDAEELGVKKVGYLRVKLQFKSGVGKVHTKFDNNPDAKSVMEAWRCCVAIGLRSVSGDFVDHGTDAAGYPDGLVGKISDQEEEDAVGEEGEDNDPYQSESDDDEDDGSTHMDRVGGAKRFRREEDEIKGEISSSSQSCLEPSEEEDAFSSGGEGDERENENENENEVGMQRKVVEKLRRWREEKRELHRRHRGLKQYKAVRTATWISNSAKSKGSMAIKRISLQDKRTNDVETEL